MKKKLKISLAEKSPDLAKQWHPNKNGKILPRDVSYGSGKYAWWICPKKHEWKARILNRVYGRGCPYCSHKIVTTDYCLSRKYPHLVAEWDTVKNGKLSPFNVSPNSNKKVWWKCKKCGWDWETQINLRSKGRGCPHCNGTSIVHGGNCLANVNPRLSKEWNFDKNMGVTPHGIRANSNKKVWWKCSKGHEWTSTVAHRNDGRGCPYCCKVVAKDGEICDSLVEAYWYLRLKAGKRRFVHNGRYGKGKFRFDFYFPFLNKYLEVTAFRKDSINYTGYYKNIMAKKKYVEGVLNGKFEFISQTLTPKQLRYVRDNIE